MNARVPAMDEARPHFTNSGVRWSCRDVNGVTPNDNTSDDRGQEYCEYFSMLHTNGIPSIIAGAPFCDSSTACEEGVCDESINSCVTGLAADLTQPADVLGKNIDNADKVTGLDPKLEAGQLEWLAANPDSKVGECVFTSWHADIDTAPNSTEKVGGYALGAKSTNASIPLFRMAVQFNTNGAAQTLVGDCLKGGNPEIEDGFTRGCMTCADTNCVPWRKSDPSVCTMAMRISECGCEVGIKDASGGSRNLDLSNPDDVELAKELFVPQSRRGFTLGTWDGISQLPSGCRYVKMGDSGAVTVNGVTVDDPNADQTLVTCDLKGSHVTAAAKDPKEACRLTYGEEVVVHVRAPVAELATLSCKSEEPSCQGIPWNIDNL